MTITLALAAHGPLVLAVDPGGYLGPTNSPSLTPQLAVFSTIAGILTPFLVAIINQPRWSSFVRALIVIGSSVGIGALAAAGEGQLNGLRWSVAALNVLAAAVAAYGTLWRNAAPAVEAATSPPDQGA